MILPPLSHIRLKSSHHKAALFWLGLLYRRPTYYQEEVKSLSRVKKLWASLKLYIHALPYILILCIIGRMIIFGVLEIPTQGNVNVFKFHLFEVSVGMVGGLAIIIVGSVIGRSIVGIGSGFALIIALGTVNGSAEGIVVAIGGGIALGVALGVALGESGNLDFVYGLIMSLEIELKRDREHLVGIVIGCATGLLFGVMIGSLTGLTNGIAFGISAIISCLRIYYHPLFWWLAWPKPKGRLYPMHPVAWDDLCLIPFWGLPRLLVAYTYCFSEQAEVEVKRLSEDYSAQKCSALKAKTILLAEKIANISKLSELNGLLSGLPEGSCGFLAQSQSLRDRINEISQTQLLFDTITRPFMRIHLGQALREKIENFQYWISDVKEPVRSAFHKASLHWSELANIQFEQTQNVLRKEQTPRVFRAGDPVKREQEAFVPRYDIMGDLERQITLATGCPGLILYGRRRMGKSTILGNLVGFLPETITTLFVSMQNPQASTSLMSWMNHIMRKLFKLVPQFAVKQPLTNDLSGFMQSLSDYNSYLSQTSKRILFAIDEYENLDRKIGEKVFPEDLLATIRESIQTHRNITWIFAGSHEITELKHAEWPSYLVSARTIEVPMFTMAETRLLLTEPLKFSPLFKDESKRPRFEPGFWGENGIERIQREAGGWPHLVQLIAETIVDVINDADQPRVDDELFERALNKAIVSGHNVLYQLLHGESTLPGEWEYLSAFRARETQPLPGEEALYVSLRRRLLMEETNGEWRLRVPLMARWLKRRG